MDVDPVKEDDDWMDFEYDRAGPSTRTLPPLPRYLPRQARFAPSAEVAERMDTQGTAATGSVMGGMRTIKSLR